MKSFATAFAFIVLATPAYARHHHHQSHNQIHRLHNDFVAEKIAGFIEILGEQFRFVSGGAGRGPIPYGDYEITPSDVGDWGARHGALGLNHNDNIQDPKIKREREGIEIHAATRDRTAGCVGIRENYPVFKTLVSKVINENGHAWLHIWPDKQAVTESKERPAQVASK